MKRMPLLTLVCSLLVIYSHAFAMKNDTIEFDTASQTISNYGPTIARASSLFDIPQQIIIGVILTESGGDSLARAKTTSAKGLMQTIDSTFETAYRAIKARGIIIANDPFDPTASILAGAWYLNKMYDQAVADLKANPHERHQLRAWKAALEYYFAGPGNGVKPQNKITVYSKGVYRTIDKQKYSDKVIYTASNLFYNNLSRQQTPRPKIPPTHQNTYPNNHYSGAYRQAPDKGFD